MKIDTNTLLLIGGGLLAYYLYKNNRGMIAGGNCWSTGPQWLKFEDKCQKCPQIVIQNGIVAPTPFQNECMKTGRSRGNLEGTMIPSPSQFNCPKGQTYTKRIYWNGGSFQGCATPEKIKSMNLMSIIS